MCAIRRFKTTLLTVVSQIVRSIMYNGDIEKLRKKKILGTVPLYYIEK